MDAGDLLFRYVSKHRRAKLKDVLAQKAKVDVQPTALDALAANTRHCRIGGARRSFRYCS
jgi:hypothetical protein